MRFSELNGARKTDMRRGINILLLCICQTIYTANQKLAAQEVAAISSMDARKALSEFLNEIVNHCCYEFAYSTRLTRATGAPREGEGICVCVHLDDMYLFEKVKKLPSESGEAAKEQLPTGSPFNVQYVWKPPHMPIRVDFLTNTEGVKSPKTVIGVQRDNVQPIDMIFAGTHLAYLFGGFGPADFSLKQIANSDRQMSISVDTAVIESVFGVFTIKFVKINNRFCVRHLKLVQKGDNQLHRRVNQKLREVRKLPNMKPSKNGILSAVYEVDLTYTYDRAIDQMHLDEFVSTDRVSNESSSCKELVKLKCLKYRRITDFDEISKEYLVKIPEGFPAILPGDKNKISLMWKNGALVRRVDGQALEAHIPRPAPNRRLHVSLAAVTLLAIACLVYVMVIRVGRRLKRNRGRVT